jgi:hypothetical protein
LTLRAVLVPLFFIPYIKEMIFEALVIMHTIEQTSGNFKWYTKVDDDGIYLGAIPILEDHLYTISKKLNINAVLTINMESDTLIIYKKNTNPYRSPI